MDTPVMIRVVDLFEEYEKYFGKDSKIAKDEQLAAFVDANLAELLKNPSDPDAAKQVEEKIEALKKDGIDKQKYAGLLCLLAKLYSENKLGAKQNPSISS